MSRFILKWRYMKSSGKRAFNTVRYIATREGVEKCDESWKQKAVTKAQEKMIKELVSDFPDAKDSFEYQEYEQNKNRYTASQFITKAIDENVDRLGRKENYVKYIAMRPNVEKDGAHGLFSMTDEPIQLKAVAEEVGNHDGAVWTMIMSLRREDAAKLGYDNAKAWKDLLRGQSLTLAKHMRISPEDLEWYAAFHNEGSHPHVHVIAYSKGKEPYMTRKGLENLKSSFANEIFKQDLYHVFVQQTQVRDELRGEGKKKAAELVAKIQAGGYQNETAEELLKALAEKLRDYKGKRVYGYLPQGTKNLVDGLVEELSKDERLQELYELWYQEKDKIVGTYQDAPANRIPLSKNEEFKNIRNAVLKEAFDYLYADKKGGTKQGKGSSKSSQGGGYSQKTNNSNYTPPSAAPAVVRLFHHLSRMVQSRLDDYYNRKHLAVDRKERRAIDEKKKAQGLKQE